MIQNQQLFSEAYVRETQGRAHAPGAVAACRRTIREWREECAVGSDAQAALSYIGQVLSALGVAYAPLAPPGAGFRLLGAGAAEGGATGLCLWVDDADLGRTTKGRHHQVTAIRALRDAGLSWGVLTNGARWRLCWADSPAPYEVFLEADLDALLGSGDLAAFGAFLHFFGAGAWAPGGLDGFRAASDKRVEAIERHLKGRIESLLQTLCLGFVADEAAGSYSRETLDIIYKNAIHLLYRLLFLFYAEARNLLPVGQTAYDALSLAALVRDARRAQQEGAAHADPHAFWKRLRDLFAVVDYGDSAVGVAAYNGGLFSDEEKPYLKDHHIANAFLTPALVALGFEETRAGVLQNIDYRDLSVRHLGTLYEGLLEYKLNLVQTEPVIVREAGGKRLFLDESLAGTVKKGETVLEVGSVYFADDKGERKSSGSYYTPEDVVQYIVAQTVTPKLVERRTALDTLLDELRAEHAVAPTDEARAQIAAFADGRTVETAQSDILGLRILDPAMGSGHFLVAAGQTVTNFLVETLNATPWANDALSTDPLVWKRRVVERCLYGVDKNDLAQELAKLALWISSASVGKPLTFLDPHLKCGNSLYGAPMRRLSLLPASKSTHANTLFGDLASQVVRGLTAQVGQITGADSEHIADVKQKAAQYRHTEQVTRRLSDIANVWLASLFDLKGDAGKPLDDTEYDYLLNMGMQNRDADSWEALVRGNRVLSDARAIAAEREFFHWELQFPDAVVDGECRFDAVIANPPYVGLSPDQAINVLFQSARCGDLYGWILERSINVASNGAIGLVVPLSIMFGKSFASLRQLFLTQKLDLHLSSYDNIPDCLFNSSSVGGDSKSMQRTTVVLAKPSSGPSSIKTTDLLKWWANDRPKLFSNMTFAEASGYCSAESFPRLGHAKLLPFWSRLKNLRQPLSQFAEDITSESRRPLTDTLCLTVPRAVNYFISATPGFMPRNKVLSLTFKTKDDMDLGRVLLNSNLFFWYWRVCGDGFLLGVDVIGNFPIPEAYDSDYITLAKRLDAVLQECTTFKLYRGERIPSYNFNKRMDILLDIDDWIVKHVAPDLNLPRDIFAQYKSNSFLRPLDLSALTGAAADAEDEE